MKKLVCILLAAAVLLGAGVSALADGAAADYAGLVTDAYASQYGDEWGSYGFAVPRINWDGDGIQAVNDAIWSELYEGLLRGESGALTAIEGGWSPEPYQMSYAWAVNGDVLSLRTVSSYSDDYNVYGVYNVSLSVGRRICDSELLSVLGIGQDDFYAQAGTVLSDTFEQQCGAFPEDDFKAQQRADNNSDANVRAVQPYLDENGDLCMIGTVYTLAGAGQYAQPLTVLGRDQLPQTVSSAGLPQEQPADERLTYFLEHCDSEYLTRADIEGFDAKMCEYARNGVYARAGRKFLSTELQEYFSQFDWYNPTIEAGQFADSMLSSVQQANVALVLNYETEKGY